MVFSFPSTRDLLSSALPAALRSIMSTPEPNPPAQHGAGDSTSVADAGNIPAATATPAPATSNAGPKANGAAATAIVADNSSIMMEVEKHESGTNGTISLNDILDSDNAELVHPGVRDDGRGVDGSDDDDNDESGSGSGSGADAGKGKRKEAYCSECEDQPSHVFCIECNDEYCDVCFRSQHRKSRRGHTTRPVEGTAAGASSSARSRGHAKTNGGGGGEDVDGAADMDISESESEGSKDHMADTDADAKSSSTTHHGIPSAGDAVGEWFVERSKFIPVRLTLPERKLLRLLEAALSVSEYTDKVDILAFASKPKRIVNQIRELCAILSGLLLAADYKLGQELFAHRDFEANAEFFRRVFELGRRHKIMNPDKMRTTYGKLMYVLMDAQTAQVREMLGFECVEPIRTVYGVLEAHGALDLLRDDRVAIATREIVAEGRSRHEIQREIKAKERAIEVLATRYARRGLDPDTIRQCLYSIGDNHAFLRVNRDPCDKMIGYLKKYFHPTRAEEGASLAIRSGRGGARLSHDHGKQYAYVLQSLTLWSGILHDMFHLWSLAEQDLLSTQATYRLRDTGQGLNRVQPAPKTARMMQIILQRAQKSVGGWVGSSVIHMGDHNVPNALMFIDKYSQIYRILLPICTTLSLIPTLTQKPALKKLIESEYGSVEDLNREILMDFFRHGFDGSGADNFFDAGSCIDGRLTSAWNWCASLERKRYFPIFLLTGFVGFDGQW
ncbi:hypothetical protein BOTBODRAFT_33707 [Botryobasidium botryosum FD-172 SS1]|uniref:B box-type domain-containing protein n=1 Tax=Botryobasidium botryosum (strain FD-172 SS1) TaxID=930990 RepID=A0A067MFF2_BOTB1|nr:hypothetical protein BOTBODRAFT_33707 [Botryobasidium botryosum FD-172 SS1]